MVQRPSSNLDRILDQALDQIDDPEVDLALLSKQQFDRILDHIEDPEVGLALLAKRPAELTPEQALNYMFWRGQFEHWQDWLAGNALAVAGAMMTCVLVDRRPPAWLCRAVQKLCMPDDEKRACDDLAKHVMRWEAVELLRGQLPNDPRNREERVCGDDVWLEAAELLADTDAAGLPDTVRKSHALIQRAKIMRAGGVTITLQAYKRAVEERDRHRKEKKQG